MTRDGAQSGGTDDGRGCPRRHKRTVIAVARVDDARPLRLDRTPIARGSRLRHLGRGAPDTPPEPRSASALPAISWE
jgi:hypothetical protein